MKRRVFIFALLLAVIPAFGQNRPDALVEFRAGNYERAVQICRGEITENPRNMDAHVVICWALLALNRYQDALTYAREAYAVNRYDSRIIEILGEIDYYEGRNAEALKYFQDYITLAPEGNRIELAYYFSGEIYIRLGRFRHADIALSTAVHWRPDNALWWTRLGYARENAGDLSEAAAAYEKALSLDQQQGDARRGLDRSRKALAARTPR